MNIPRALHTLVLLNTGKVLAIGGYKEQSCELFDPQTEIWTMTDSIPTFRYGGQTVTELLDGRIMVAGGYYVDTTSWDLIILNKVDIYNPITEIWVQATPMQLERTEHTATLLNDGRVLVAGGNTNTFQTVECEIYDAINNTWSTISPMIKQRYSHATILLSNGNVFVSGGGAFPTSYSCEVYDVNFNQWRSVADLIIPRQGHQIYFLRKFDKLMIVGGGLLEFGPDTWEMYDPNQLLPIYYESFPINQFIVDNNVQLQNENIFVSGGWEFLYNPMPVFWASSRSWIFDITSNITQNNNDQKYFSLNQNYPNPFNSSTTISYTLQSPSKVELKIFDLLGKEISSLVNDYQIIGSYKVNFDANNLPDGKEILSSGIYYYRLTVMETGKSYGNAFQQTKKMILLR